MKKAASFLLAVLIAAGTVPMAGNTSAEIDMNDLPTPISSDAKAVKSFKESKPGLTVTYEQTDDYMLNGYSGAYAEAKLKWKPVKNALYYNVYKILDEDDYELAASTFENEYNDYIADFTSYCVTAVTFTYDDEMVESDYSNVSDSSSLSTVSSDRKAVQAFESTKPRLKGSRSSRNGSVELNWEPVKNAIYYKVYIREKGEKKFSEKTLTFDTQYHCYLYEACEFRINALALTDDGRTVESDFSNTYKLRISPSPVTEKGGNIDAGEGVVGEGSVILEETDDYYDSERYAENTEEYSDARESGYKNAATDPVSTFSADVDTASYANLRRLIKGGDTIPEDAVRIEEMLNYFDYNYVQPTGESPFSLTYELSDCPWNKDSKLMMIGVQGRDIPEEKTPDSNLVFLIDVSGSMYSDDKLPLVIKSVNTLMDTMTENDRISVITYSGNERIVLAGARGNQTKTAETVTGMLDANGCTDGESGIRAAYELAEKYYIEGGNNRIILASDGDLNVGITDTDELVKLIEEKRESGIYLTTLGFGGDNLKDEKMEALADNGNGSYHYIDSAKEAQKVLLEERNSTIYTIAKDVKLQVEFNPQNVKSYRLVGYDNRRLNNEDFENDDKDAGDVGAGHSVTVLYEIIPADGSKTGGLKYQQNTGKNADEWCTLKVRYKLPQETKSRMISAAIKGSLYSPAEKMSTRMRFACAVTEFGLILKDSDYKGTASLSNIKKLLSGIGSRIGYSDDLEELVRLYEEKYGE